MANCVLSTEFVKEAIRIATQPTTTYEGYKCLGLTRYKNGGVGNFNGVVHTCDCRGYILWVLRNLGLDTSSEGTNAMIRQQMTSWKKVSSAAELEPGMAVFKYRTSTAKLKAKYLKGGSAYNAKVGQIDVYHVGIVVQTTPTLVIHHCSTSGKNSGILTDTKIGDWKIAGWVKWVKQNETAIQEPIKMEVDAVSGAAPKVLKMKVFAEKGGTVNMRTAPNTAAKLLDRVPIGSQVQIIEAGANWNKIMYKNKIGYMMNEFLI